VLLLGPPGAGRTTLLEVLSGRKKRSSTNLISGDILLNGQPWNSHFNRVAGYVTQEDVHVRTCQAPSHALDRPRILSVPSVG